MSTTTTKTKESPKLALSEHKKNAYLVLSTLLAMTAFRMGVSPPGGLWSEDGAMIKALFDKSSEDPIDYKQLLRTQKEWDIDSDMAAAGSPIMARNCKTGFFIFNVLNHSILFTSLIATGILLSNARVKRAVPALLLYSTVATGINYILVTSCLTGLLFNITIPAWAVQPWTVLFAVLTILLMHWAWASHRRSMDADASA